MRWLPVALVSVLVVGLAVVTAVVLSGSKTNKSNSPVGTTAARAQAASTVTKGSKWLAGSGTPLLTAVNADLGKISTAQHAGSHAAARAAGARLAADATVALRGPMPPVDAKVYRSALKDLKAAGSYEAGGDFRKAARLLAAGAGRHHESHRGGGPSGQGEDARDSRAERGVTYKESEPRPNN